MENAFNKGFINNYPFFVSFDSLGFETSQNAVYSIHALPRPQPYHARLLTLGR
jgi:hypothetical protein